MNKKRFFIGVGVSLAVAMMVCLWGSETIYAMECQVIKIKPSDKASMEKPVTVDPETLVVSVGDCVFWANISRELVRIKFLGDEECIADPVGFACEKGQKYFTTDYYGVGGSVSIHLMKTGTYNYEISTKQEPTAKITGKIEVK